MSDSRASDLDWARWYDGSTAWPIDRKLFLADAVMQLGPMMVFPWSDGLPLATMAKPQPFLPGNLDAFNLDRTPRKKIHDAWAPAVLAYMSAAEFTSIDLGSSDPAAWLAAHVADAKTGAPVFDPKRAYTDDGSVSFDHWTYAAWEAAMINEDRKAGLVAMPHLARAIARMALDGDLRFSARPIGGGDHVLVDADDWEIDDPLPRIASCSINMSSPRSVTAKPTHLLFAEPDGFEAAAWIHARRYPLALLEEGITPADSGMIGPKPSLVWKALEDKALRVMRRHLIESPAEYHRPKLKKVVSIEIGRVGKSVFENARDRLQKEFGYISEPGAPVGTERR